MNRLRDAWAVLLGRKVAAEVPSTRWWMTSTPTGTTTDGQTFTYTC